MAGAAVPYLMGASVVKGFIDQENARKELRTAEGRAQALTQRQVNLFDQMLAEANKGLGQLDYDKMLAERTGMIQRQTETGMKNLATAFRTQGFRPGDTPSTLAYQRASQQYLQQLADTEQQLKAQLAQQRMGILGSVSPGYLNPSIQQAGQQQALAQQQYQSINPFAAALPLIQYLPGMEKEKTT